MRAFQPVRRGALVVVATNVAEASVTISTSHVIDCCFVKIRSYVPSSGAEGYVVVPRRAHRACRGPAARSRAAGQNVRLCTEASTAPLPERNVPECSAATWRPSSCSSPGVDNIVSSTTLAAAVGAGCARLELLCAGRTWRPPDGPARGKMSSSRWTSTGRCLLTSPHLLAKRWRPSAMLQVQEFVTPRGQRRKHGARSLFTAPGGRPPDVPERLPRVCQGEADARWARRYYLNHRALSAPRPCGRSQATCAGSACPSCHARTTPTPCGYRVGFFARGAAVSGRLVQDRARRPPPAHPPSSVLFSARRPVADLRAGRNGPLVHARRDDHRAAVADRARLTTTSGAGGGSGRGRAGAEAGALTRQCLWLTACGRVPSMRTRGAHARRKDDASMPTA